MRLIGKLALTFATAVALCTANANAADDNLRIAYPVDVQNWYPPSQTSGPAMSIVNAVFDTAIGLSPELKLIPRAIEKWEWSDDNLKLHLTMRDGMYFHNGDKVTAEDLKFTFERYKEEKLAQSATYRPITEITIESELEATFHLSRPFLTLPARLSIFGSSIIPKKYVEEVGLEGFEKNPVGSGPYKLVRYDRDSRIVLEAFEDYWAGEPEIENVTIEIVKDTTARVAAIESNQVDLTIDLPNRLIPRLDGIDGLDAKTLPYPAQIQMLMVTNRGAFADDNVRLAVHHAINKEALSKAFYNGVAEPISVLAPSGFPGDVPGYDFGFSKEKAAEYLAKSGYSVENPVTIKFLTTNGVYTNDYDVARAIAQMLKDVGINSDLEVIELAKYFELNHNNKLPEMTLFHWSNPTGDPEIYPGGILDSNRPFSAWKSEEAGNVIAGLMKETNEEKRFQGYSDLNKIAAERGWIIPLLVPTMTMAYKSNLEFTPNQTGWLSIGDMRWK